MASSNSRTVTDDAAPSTVTLPAPTAWPIVLAFGVTLLFAGLVTSASVSLLGAILVIAGCVGWFRDVLPHEKQEVIRVSAEIPFLTTTSRRVVERLPVAPELSRALLPLETYPVSAGIKGGLAGSVAMAVLACLYGLSSKEASGIRSTFSRRQSILNPCGSESASLNTFHLGSFLSRSCSIWSRLYSWGCSMEQCCRCFHDAQFFWEVSSLPFCGRGCCTAFSDSSIHCSTKHIDWRWFIASQFAFGIVAGLVVIRQERVPSDSSCRLPCARELRLRE